MLILEDDRIASITRMIRASFVWICIIRVRENACLSKEVGKWGKVARSLINHVIYLLYNFIYKINK
jgi:hypothetical protein